MLSLVYILIGMKVYLLILLFIGITCYKEWWEYSVVPHLTKSDYFDVVGKEKWVFIKFYTTWCGYCRKMAPEFDKLYDIISKTRNDIVVRRLEGDSNEAITSGYDIHSYPKLVLFKPGSIDIYAMYKGKRTAEEFINFLNKNIVIEDSSKGLVTNTEIKEVSKKSSHIDIKAENINIDNIDLTNIIPSLENKQHSKPALSDSLSENKKSYNKKINNNKHLNTGDNDEKDKDDIEFLKQEINVLKDQLNSSNKNIINITQPQSAIDYILIIVFIVILISVIVTIKRIYNKLKIT